MTLQPAFRLFKLSKVILRANLGGRDQDSEGSAHVLRSAHLRIELQFGYYYHSHVFFVIISERDSEDRGDHHKLWCAETSELSECFRHRL